MSSIASLQNIQNEYAEIKKKYQDQLQEKFKLVLNEIFKENPSLLAIEWTQFTPYFNDGDACIFGVQEVGFYIKGPNFDEKDLKKLSYNHYQDEDNLGDDLDKSVIIVDGYSVKREENIEGDLAQTLHNFYEILYGMSDVLETTFGDHVHVIVKPKGVDVEEYDHD